MKTAEKFRQEISSLITEISRDNRDVVIVGAGRGGWYVRQTLAKKGITITAFADNNPDKHGSYCGTPVMALQAAAELLPDAIYLPGLLGTKNQRAISTQLETLGIKDTRHLMPSILFDYFTEATRRNCDPEALAVTLDRYFTHTTGSQNISPSLSCIITQKCSLCCKECGAFVPEIVSPKTYPVARVVENVRAYCSAFDVVHHIALQGGEPFMHRNLEEIVSGIAEIPNLIFIDVVTNGTITPKQRTLNTLSKNGVCVIVSDYGEASSQAAEVTRLCSDNVIFTDYYRYTTDSDWGMQHPIFERNRDSGENDRIFRNCTAHESVCCQIMDGKLHRCSFSNFTQNLGLIPFFESDCVDLEQQSDADNMGDRIRQLAFRQTALHACDHCPASSRGRIGAGIQVPKPARTKCSS